MAVKIKHKNGRYYGYASKEHTPDCGELLERITRALYDPFGNLDGDGSTGFTDEDWNETLLEKHIDRNRRDAAIRNERLRKRKEARKKAAARRLAFRFLVSTAVVLLIVGGVLLATLEWWMSVPVFLVAFLLEFFVLGGDGS